MLEHIQVECYGTQVLLNTVAGVLSLDRRNLIIKPFDPNIISDIEKAIYRSKLGLSPIRESKLIRVHVPPLSEERRVDLVKEAKAVSQDQKISIRNIRRDMIKTYVPKSDDEKKNFISSIGSLTEKVITKIEDILTIKVDSLMDVEGKWNQDPKDRK